MSAFSSAARVRDIKDSEPEYGRPLSIIESVASGEEGASDDEEEADRRTEEGDRESERRRREETTPGTMTPPHPSPSPESTSPRMEEGAVADANLTMTKKGADPSAASSSSNDSQVTKLSDESTLEDHIQSLFLKFVPVTSGTDHAQDGQEAERCVRCRDLPKLFDEYERQRGSRLVSDRLRDELTQQVSQSPDVEISAGTLLQLIGALQAAQPESDTDEETDAAVALRRGRLGGGGGAASGGEESSFSSADDSSSISSSASSSSNNGEEDEEEGNGGLGGRAATVGYRRSNSSRDGGSKAGTPVVGGKLRLNDEDDGIDGHDNDEGNLRAFPRSQSERGRLGQGSSRDTDNGESNGQHDGEDMDRLTPGPSAYASMRETPRKKVTSDPSDSPYNSRRVSAPASAPAGPSKRTRGDEHGKRAERRRSIDPENREVLRGKGKLQAPPSAWSRPKPQALANREKERQRERQRKRSDASSRGVSPDHPQNSPSLLARDRDTAMSDSVDDGQTALGLGHPQTPSTPTSPPSLGNTARRQRLSSQPTMQLDSTPPSSMPRSSSYSSTSFAFPRAVSPPWDDEHEARANERWSAMLDDIDSPGRSTKLPASASAGSTFYESARSPSSRAASPGIDESSIGQFNSFGALASVVGGGGGNEAAGPRSPRRPSSRASASARRYRFDSDEAEATMMQGDDGEDLHSQLEALQRTLHERERTHNEVQEEHEAIISSLQSEIEVLKEQQAAMRREEKEANAREAGQTELINNLEADLSREQKLHEILKGQHNRLKVQLDDQKNESKKLREAASADKQTMEKLEGAQVGFVATNQRLADEISKKQAKIEELQAKVSLLETQKAELEEMETTNADLREKIERLTAELEMKGSSEILHRGDFDQNSSKATPSRTLGAEMQRLLESANAAARGDEDDEDDDQDRREASTDSLYETIITRRHTRGSKSKSKNKAITSSREEAQDGDETEAESSRRIEPGDLFAPPTYDEAALEKSIVSRLHPTCKLEQSDPSAVSDDSHRLAEGLVGLLVGGQRMSATYHYEMLTRSLGVRCQAFETRLEEHKKTLDESSSSSTSEVQNSVRAKPLTLVSSRLFQGVRPLAKQARDMVPHALRSRIQSHVQSVLDTLLPRDQAEESARRLVLLCTLAVLLLGICLGMWWKPRTRWVISGEDALEWRLSNSLGLGLGGGYLDYRDAYVDEGLLSWFTSWLLQSQSASLDMRPRLVPT